MEEAFVSQDIKYDESVKSRMIVIPAQAGIQRLQMVLKKHWTPVFTGVTTFYESVKNCLTINMAVLQWLDDIKVKRTIRYC